MGLTQQAIKDNQQITGNTGDWGVEITLRSPSGGVAIVNGFHTKHHLGIDNDGLQVNSKAASVAFNEGNLPHGYSVRIDTPGHRMHGEVNLKDYLIDVSDSTTVVKNYKAGQWFPDEKLNMIIIILQDYAAD